MDGFTKLPKMQCFKEGGSVLKDVDADKNPGLSKLPTEVRNNMGYKKEGGAVDMAQDKKIVKKAFAMHDKQEHEGEKTDLSKLKKGGRTKKDCGTVKKYKCGGGVYGAKKTKEDIKSIEAAKNYKPKKLQMGGMTGPAPAGPMATAPSAPMGQGAISDMEKRRMMEKMKRAKGLGPAQQSELINQSPAAAGLVPPPAGQYKKGGKACK